ncbi:MAG: glycosyltransferase family 4 protein [Myxococcaceae bacterium]
MLLCNTPEERDLIARRFPHHAPAKVVGVGVESARGEPARFRERHAVAGPYLLYVGRVEEGKGVGELLALHRRLRARDAGAPELLLAGHSSMSISQPGVRYLGRIEEQDKLDGLAGATAAVVPSRYESLSLLALEAFAQGTPVLGNGASEVVAGQLRRSGAGATYQDLDSFAAGLGLIGLNRKKLSTKARAFANRQSWAKVVSAYRAELRRIMETPR